MYHNLGIILSSLLFSYQGQLPVVVEVLWRGPDWLTIRSTYQATYTKFTVSHRHLWPKIYAKLLLRGYPASWEKWRQAA